MKECFIEFDGLILSPTREKLEPTIPRKDDDSRGSQKNSPKKSSPMKSSSLKRTNQKAKQGGPKKRKWQNLPLTVIQMEKLSRICVEIHIFSDTNYNGYCFL